MSVCGGRGSRLEDHIVETGSGTENKTNNLSESLSELEEASKSRRPQKKS